MGRNALFPHDVLGAYRAGGRLGMSPTRDDAERWCMLAREARNVTLEITDPEAKRALLFIAAAYERLARGAQKRKDQSK